MKKSIATIETDIGTMTIYYNGENVPLTAEKDETVKELEYSPASIDGAIKAVEFMYQLPEWSLAWTE